MKHNRIPGLVKPRTFAKRNGIPWEHIQLIVHYRNINGLAQSGAIEVLLRGSQEKKANMSLFVHEERFAAWLAETNLAKLKGNAQATPTNTILT